MICPRCGTDQSDYDLCGWCGNQIFFGDLAEIVGIARELVASGDPKPWRIAEWQRAIADLERAAGVDLKPCEHDGARSTTDEALRMVR